MRQAICTVVTAAAITFSGSAGVGAQEVIEDIISIPVDSVLRAAPGTVTQIATAPVPEAFQGSDCIAEVESINQESVHPDNDLILVSGETSGEVLDFESEAFQDTTAEIPLTLGTDLVVSLRMGPNGVSSGGVLITVDCTRVTESTTTVAATTTTDAATTTTVAATTTDAATTTTDAATTTTSVGNLAPTTTIPTPPPTQLPPTGSNDRMALIGLVTLASGVALMMATRRGRPTS